MKFSATASLCLVLSLACTNQNRISGAGGDAGGGSGGGASGGRGGAGTAGTGGQPGFGGFGGFPPGADGGPPAEACSEAAKLVYVVSDENHLYTFAPNKLPDVAAAFTDLGLLGCSDPGDTVNSMAVDRHGTAYVNYASGKIFTVDTKTLACTDTGFVPGQAGFSPAPAAPGPIPACRA